MQAFRCTREHQTADEVTHTHTHTHTTLTPHPHSTHTHTTPTLHQSLHYMNSRLRFKKLEFYSSQHTSCERCIITVCNIILGTRTIEIWYHCYNTCGSCCADNSRCAPCHPPPPTFEGHESQLDQSEAESRLLATIPLATQPQLWQQCARTNKQNKQ